MIEREGNLPSCGQQAGDVQNKTCLLTAGRQVCRLQPIDGSLDILLMLK